MNTREPKQVNFTAQQKYRELQDELEREFYLVCSRVVIENQIDQLRPSLT